MRSFLKGIKKSESKIDDFLGHIIGVLVYKSTLFKSWKVRFVNRGKLLINGSLYFGTFTNRNGLDPSAVGVFKIFKEGTVHINGKVRIARDCKIYVPGSLIIEDGTYVNPGTMIFARTRIRIGSGCAIAWNCQIVDDDFHELIVENRRVNYPQEINIGNKVWIGAGSKILKGTIIEDNVVVAAGSIVTGHLLANSVYAGVPAKRIRENVTWK